MDEALVPEHTFETFSWACCSRFALAAGVAVAETPGTAYNPLLIYGGPGAARTHLLHAIGNYARELYPSLDIRYIQAAEFGPEFAIASRNDQEDDFRSRYLNVGMLLVDDIQLMQDTETVQAEFLHVFNALHNDGRQLVISSDRAPGSLAGINDGLRDRLGRGLVPGMTTDTDGTA